MADTSGSTHDIFFQHETRQEPSRTEPNRTQRVSVSGYDTAAGYARMSITLNSYVRTITTGPVRLPDTAHAQNWSWLGFFFFFKLYFTFSKDRWAFLLLNIS